MMMDEIAECPWCKRWTDVGPSFNEDSTLQQFDCGTCGNGPDGFVSSYEDAVSAWNKWAATQEIEIQRSPNAHG